MALNVKKTKSFVQQETLEEGAYPARVVQIIDYGVQAQRSFQGQEKPPKQDMYVTYELLDVFMKDKNGNELEDKPRWISERFPLSSLDSDLAKSTKRYNALDPNGDFDGDFTQLIGAACMVTVGINKKGDKVYENILNVGPMRPKDAAKAPALKNPSKIFLLDEPDMDVFRALPEWQQKEIQKNLNYRGSVLEDLLSGKEGGSKGQAVRKAQKAVEEVVEGNEEDDLPW